MKTLSQLQCKEAFVSRMQVRLHALDVIRTIIIQCTRCYQDKLSEQSGKYGQTQGIFNWKLSAGVRLLLGALKMGAKHDS